MTGAGASAQKTTYDLDAVKNFDLPEKTMSGQLAIPEPSAVAMLQTQRFMFEPVRDVPGFAEVMWADSIPKLFQARLIESFENYDLSDAPLRSAELGQSDYQLLIDIRRFRIALNDHPTAEIALSARIVDKNGKTVASRLIEQFEQLDRLEPAVAAVAFNAAFGRIEKDLVGWVVRAL
jgi:phospholipid/cholesterol/gamma-HCH transport system substrate-binding protein